MIFMDSQKKVLNVKRACHNYDYPNYNYDYPKLYLWIVRKTF